MSDEEGFVQEKSYEKSYGAVEEGSGNVEMDTIETPGMALRSWNPVQATKNFLVEERRRGLRGSALRMIVNMGTVKVLGILLMVVVALFLYMLQTETSHNTVYLRGADAGAPAQVPLYGSRPLDVIHVNVEVSKASGRALNVSVEGLTRSDAPVWERLDSMWTVTTSHEEQVSEEHRFQLSSHDQDHYAKWRLTFSTNDSTPIDGGNSVLGLSIEVEQLLWIVNYEVPIAAAVLVGVYFLIVFEIVHRTVAALLGAFWAVGVLSMLHSRPTFPEVIAWIDWDTIGLLFGMMLLVGIFGETGFFEWIAVKAYRISRGKIWRLTTILCLFTAVVSAFLDNVTTIMLLTPVTISLCKVIKVDPVPLIMAEVFFSNVGGTATPIGDPPNILIYNDRKIQDKGNVTFFTFTLHIAPGVILAIVGLYLWVWLVLKRKIRPEPSKQLISELEIWRRTLRSMDPNDDDADTVAIADHLRRHISSLEAEIRNPAAATPIDIKEIERKYVIRDRALLLNSSIVLAIVIIMFFIHSIPQLNIELPWIAMIGAMVMLVVAGKKDIEEVLEKVEFSTLLFFGGLFILMRALENLGLMTYLATLVAEAVRAIPEGKVREAFAVTLIMLVSALVSAFIDNIPFTVSMIPVVTQLGVDEKELGLDLEPLVWALVYGCCLGGNGSLIGASANVVAAGLAESDGYPIRFNSFFIYGFPTMIITVLIALAYTLLFHVVIPWH